MAKKSKKKARKSARKHKDTPKGGRKAPTSGRKVARKSASKGSAKAGSKGQAAGPSAGATALRDHALAHARFAREYVAKKLDTLKDHLMAQPAGLPNHALWQYGHLAVSTQWFTQTISKSEPGADPAWDKLFGMNSVPVSDAGAYPPPAEVIKAFHDSMDRLVRVVEGLDDQALNQPTEIDTGGFLSSRLDALYKHAWHEGWHLGQVTDLRRALGITG